jgi:hypothetical protein
MICPASINARVLVDLFFFSEHCLSELSACKCLLAGLWAKLFHPYKNATPAGFFKKKKGWACFSHTHP